MRDLDAIERQLDQMRATHWAARKAGANVPDPELVRQVNTLNFERLKAKNGWQDG